MDKLIEKMNNPFDGLSKDGFQEKCFDIAKELFCNYCINCNGKVYYFAEIEFYYWDKDNWNEKWNRVTYPRISEATDLFFHLSGVDICFKSYYNEKNLNDEAKFGGILIRAIRDKNGNITAGPWNCMLKILNDCIGGHMPCLKGLVIPCDSEENIEKTYRSLGKIDLEAEKEIATSKVTPLNLCFYDNRYISSSNNNLLKKSKITLDHNSGKLKTSYCSYKTDRFNQ